MNRGPGDWIDVHRAAGLEIQTHSEYATCDGSDGILTIVFLSKIIPTIRDAVLVLNCKQTYTDISMAYQFQTERQLFVLRWELPHWMEDWEYLQIIITATSSFTMRCLGWMHSSRIENRHSPHQTRATEKSGNPSSSVPTWLIMPYETYEVRSSN